MGIKGMKVVNSGQFKKDFTPWNKGVKGYSTSKKGRKFKPLSSEQRMNISLSMPKGENNINWKGDRVSYRSLHKWVERQLGKANKCMNNITHTSTRYHWSNVSKEYKRNLSDWIQLCPSCNCKDRIGRRVSP